MDLRSWTDNIPVASTTGEDTVRLSKRKAVAGDSPGAAPARVARDQGVLDLLDLEDDQVARGLREQLPLVSDPYQHYPEAATIDFARHAGVVLRWIRPLASDSTLWLWRAERTLGITSAAHAQLVVYTMWIVECGWDHKLGHLAEIQEGRIVADALHYHKAPRFRSSATKGLTPADREKARAFPKLPRAPESFKHCFLQYLKTGTVLAEAKHDPGVSEVPAERESGVASPKEILYDGSPQMKALVSPFRGSSKRKCGRSGKRTGESTPQMAARADGSPVRRSSSVEDKEVAPMGKASEYLGAECSSRSVSSLLELLRACEPQ